MPKNHPAGLVLLLGFFAYGCAGASIKAEQHCASSDRKETIACLESLSASSGESKACSIELSEEPPSCAGVNVMPSGLAYSQKDMAAIALGKKKVDVVCAYYEGGRDSGRIIELIGLDASRAARRRQPPMGAVPLQALTEKSALRLRYELYANRGGGRGLQARRAVKASRVEGRSVGCILQQYVAEQSAAETRAAIEEVARRQEAAAEERRQNKEAARVERERVKEVAKWQAKEVKGCAKDWNPKACGAPIDAANEDEVAHCKTECLSAIKASIRAAGIAATETCSEAYLKSKTKGLKTCVISKRSADASVSEALSTTEKTCRKECPARAKELKRIAQEEAKQARAAEKERKRIEKLHKKAGRCMKSCMKKAFKCQERYSVMMCNEMGAGLNSCSKKCCGASGNCSCGGYGRGRACGR